MDPSGLSLLKIKSPLKPTISLIILARSAIEISMPVPILICEFRVSFLFILTKSSKLKFSSKKKLTTIEEMYAIGPAVSILMDGYIETDKLVSLRGTLVPATTINRSIASIPLLGNILVGKKTGEGVFGVSFKVKGPPKDLKTTVNPVKTLTPRFITRTLEKLKKN